MKKLTFTALALMMCGAAWGAAIPQASRYDSRVQQVIYNPQNVTVVNTKPGFMTTLVFDNDEAVISAKPGFDEAWEATPDANRVNVRPVAPRRGAPEKMATQRRSIPEQPGLAYHMLVVTSKRLYNVELNVIDDKSAQQPAFQVSYRYPGEERDKASREATARQREWEQKQQQASVQKALNSAQTPRNPSYTKYPGKGSFNIVPDFAYDDGRFTFVGFSPSKSIPSVTKELNGKEHAVNSSIQKKATSPYW